jgi:hypothetical protein
MQTITWVKDLFSRKADAPVQERRPAPYLKTLSDMAGKQGRTKILPAPKLGFNAVSSVQRESTARVVFSAGYVARIGSDFFRQCYHSFITALQLDVGQPLVLVATLLPQEMMDASSDCRADSGILRSKVIRKFAERLSAPVSKASGEVQMPIEPFESSEVLDANKNHITHGNRGC